MKPRTSSRDAWPRARRTRPRRPRRTSDPRSRSARRTRLSGGRRRGGPRGTATPSRRAVGQGTGATMSDDEDDAIDSDANLFDGGLDGPDSMGLGPLIPTETERSLMEREARTEARVEAGVQGENFRYKRGNFTQEESGEASRGYYVSPRSLVAVTLNGHILRRKTRRSWCRKLVCN